MKNPKDFFFLEQVPKGYPMDVLYINLGHVNVKKRPEFALQTQGAFVLVFENGHYSIFIEKEPWFHAAKTILDYTLASDEKVKEWQERTEKWIEYMKEMNREYKNKDFGSYSNEGLVIELGRILDFEVQDGINVAEISSPNYGTNFISERLEKVLKEIGFAPHAIMPILFRTTKEFPISEYENKVGMLALDMYKSGKSEPTKEKIEEIVSEYDWIDASLVSSPKTNESVIQDVKTLFEFGEKIESILNEKALLKKKNKEERERVLEEVLSKASAEERRVIQFALESSELGRIIVDEIMKFIYYRRKIYTEISQRIGATEIDTKFLLLDEIKNCLLKNTKPDTNLIQERQKLAVYILENDQIDIYVGGEAEEWKNKLAAVISEDSSPLKGEIAFSKGKVKGIARLVKDVHEMNKVQEGDILVSSRTYPDLLPAMKRSVAVIAELGGLLSHAAIVSRELGIPCLVGVKNATSKIKDGDVLEVDTELGIISIL